MPQTPRGTLGQKMSAYQFLSNSDHVSEAPKVPGLFRISPISWTFGDVVKLGQNLIKIGMHLNFGPRLRVEFEAFIQKNGLA